MRLIARTLALAALLLALAGPGWAQGSVWEIDPVHSTAQFSVRHMMISNVRGEFGRLTGTLVLDESNPNFSTLEASIETAKVNTREPRRDAHLRSADFFDVAHYPTITFRSKRIEPLGNGNCRLTGDLTIRGVTREIPFDVEGLTAAVKDPMGNLRRGATVVARINRRDFGLLWNAALETGGVLVGDEVAITVDVELIGKSPATAATSSR